MVRLKGLYHREDWQAKQKIAEEKRQEFEKKRAEKEIKKLAHQERKKKFRDQVLQKEKLEMIIQSVETFNRLPRQQRHLLVKFGRFGKVWSNLIYGKIHSK